MFAGAFYEHVDLVAGPPFLAVAQRHRPTAAGSASLPRPVATSEDTALIDRRRTTSEPQLTSREREVLALVGEGMSNRNQDATR